VFISSSGFISYLYTRIHSFFLLERGERREGRKHIKTTAVVKRKVLFIINRTSVFVDEQYESLVDTIIGKGERDTSLQSVCITSSSKK